MKHLLVFLLLLCSTSVFAQDVIVKRDGSTVVCRVVELTSSEIVYKKWNNLNGSNYVMNRSDASAINYENGKKVNLSEATNLYTPNNQNDGTQQYNDKALLKMDYAASNPYKIVNTMKTIGWIGGGTLVACGAITFIMYLKSEYDDNANYGVFDIETGIPTIVLTGLGVGFTTTCLLIANHQKKVIDNRLHAATLYKQEFKFSNGTSLSTGIDFLSDNTDKGQLFGNNTLGLGLRYNF